MPASPAPPSRSSGAVLLMRNSERQTFKTCRHRWQWTYLEGRQSASSPTALRFGDLIHRSLEPYYKPGLKRGPHPARTFERLYAADLERASAMNVYVAEDEKWVDALPLGIAMLEGYVERYAEADREYEVVASEQTFQLLIRVRDPLLVAQVPYEYTWKPERGARAEFRFKIVGTFDGVWRRRSTGRLSFKEFKTAASIQLDGLALDEQAGTYWTYGPKWLRREGFLKEDEDISEILYSYLRKAAPNTEKARDEMGRLLNNPTKDALLAGYKVQGRKFPKGSGAKGAVTVADMLADLPGAAQLGEVSATQPAPFFERVPVYRDEADKIRQSNRIVREAINIARARFGPIEANIKTPGPLHMPNCRGCSVREACEVHEAGGDFSSVLSASMTNWNPYAAHELPERH